MSWHIHIVPQPHNKLKNSSEKSDQEVKTKKSPRSDTNTNTKKKQLFSFDVMAGTDGSNYTNTSVQTDRQSTNTKRQQKFLASA